MNYLHMGSYRILSIDGGGVKGVISARLLQRLVLAKPNLIDRVDLYAGTSTGAIICMCLAHGISLDKIFDLYYKRATEIFTRSWVRFLDMQIFAAKYTNEGLKQVLIDTFGDTKLGDLKGKVLVGALDLDTYDSFGQRSYKPKFFHNLDGQTNDILNLKVVDILMYTTAAPTYFPTYGGYIDGGVVANNPSMTALAQALDPTTPPEPALSDIQMLSIGTGKSSTYVAGDSHDWGFVEWATSIVDIMMNCRVDVTDYECRQLLKDNYIRINPYLDSEFDLDSVDMLDRMVETADSYELDYYLGWLDKHF